MIINWKIKKNCSPNLLVTTINLGKEISSWQKCELYVVGNLGNNANPSRTYRPRPCYP